jgi:hypothetical protein
VLYMTTTATRRPYRTTTLAGQTVCETCGTLAAVYAEENYLDYLVEQIGRAAATARATAGAYGNWTDADLAEVERWVLALFDDAYNNGILCSLHTDEADAHAENDDRDALAEAEAEDAAALAAEEAVVAAAAALPDRIVAEDRAETDPCQAGTPGCCIDHTAEAQRDRAADSPCETW